MDEEPEFEPDPDLWRKQREEYWLGFDDDERAREAAA